MKFKVNKQEFHKAIGKIEGIISAREIRSVVSNILLELSGDQLILTATDLEIGIKTSLPVTIEKGGSLTLPAKKLSQAIREFQYTNLIIEADSNHKVNILAADGNNRARITLMGTPGEEYPRIPDPEEGKFTSFPLKVVQEMIRKTGHSIAEEDARYVFNGLFIQNSKQRVSFVGTDGRRLAKIEREFPTALPFANGIILPNKAVRELQKLLDLDQEGRIAYDENDRRVYFKIGDVTLIAKLIEGQFPDYQQVIPGELAYRLDIDRTLFENTIRQVAVMATDPTRQVRMTFGADGINVLSSTPDLGEAQDTIGADYQGEEITIAFNSNYIMDIIRVLTADKIRLCFSSPSAPALILDPDDDDFISVIMPMKI